MTLVVARRTERSVRLFADLRVTDRNAIESGYVVGMLKPVVLGPDLCVAFAGRVGPAIVALRSLASTGVNGRELDEVRQLLLDAHRQSDGDTEFLVAPSVTAPGGLDRIAADGIETDLPATWIGDRNAFDLYQRVYHADRFDIPLPDELADQREEFELQSKMGRAMDAVVRDDSITTVGEIVVPAASTVKEPGFSYLESVGMWVGQDQEIGPEWTPIRMGGAAEGGFGYSVLVPEEPGVGAIGIHFFQGRLGLYYDPLRSDRPEEFTDVGHDEFRQAVWERHRVAIKGSKIGG